MVWRTGDGGEGTEDAEASPLCPKRQYNKRMNDMPSPSPLPPNGAPPQLTLHCVERGHGLPLLLIHGYPLDHTIWQPQLDGLADTARLLAPDLPGFGQSADHPPLATIAQFAQACHHLLEARHIPRPLAIGGVSMGGYIALAFYRQYAAEVAGLVLVATRAGPDSPEGKANRNKAIALAHEKGPAAIAESMLPKMFAPQTYSSKPELVAYLKNVMQNAPLGGITAALSAMRDRPDSTPWLAEIRPPTLILHGEQDALIPLSEATAMQQAIPRARLEIIPDAGHMPHLEQADRVNTLLRSFLTQIQDTP